MLEQRSLVTQTCKDMRSIYESRYKIIRHAKESFCDIRIVDEYMKYNIYNNGYIKYTLIYSDNISCQKRCDALKRKYINLNVLYFIHLYIFFMKMK